MPIRSMRFDRATGRDIHLIRGDTKHNTSRSILDSSLVFVEVLADGKEQDVFASDYLKNHTDVRLFFRPTFRHLDNQVSKNLENFGIHVDRANGTVVVDPGPIPGFSPANFLIEIFAFQTVVTPASVPRLAIRVHVHDGVERIWLTPDTLTVRRRTAGSAEDTGYRFTARARFTDGVVGDITLFHGVTWTPSKHFKPPPDNTRESAEAIGFIQLPAGFSGPPIIVEATLMVKGSSFLARATFSVAPPWAAEPATLSVSLLAGTPSTFAGNSPANVPNVLLLGAGFASGAETGAFKTTAAIITESFSTDQMLSPYGALSKSMNLWRTSFPAANPGLCVRGAVYLPASGGGRQAVLVPLPRKHPGGNKAWSLNNVIFALGPPLQSYLTSLRPPADSNFEEFRKFWAATVQPPELPESQQPPNIGNDGISRKTLAKWFELATTQFIDEVDSFPAFSVGVPPNADLLNRGDELALHPERGGSRGPDVETTPNPELKAFLASLKSIDGHKVPGGDLGLVWSEIRPDIAYDNHRYVVFVIAGAGGALQDRQNGVFVPIEKGTVYPVAAVAAGQLRYSRSAPVAEPSKETFPEFSRLVAHELSHAFHLQDEYAESAEDFTGKEADLSTSPNVTSLAAVVDSAGRVKPDLIKWNWDRIQKAAVLTGKVTGAPPNFSIPVVGGQQLSFKPGDRVRLRSRLPKTPLARSMDTAVTFSGLELTVVSDGIVPIQVTSASAKLSDFAPFKADSILYTPVIAEPANPASPFLKLIAPKVAASMNSSGDALSGPVAACNPVIEASIGLEDQIPAFPPLFFTELVQLFSFRNTHRAVGLYSGGLRLACRIFHPTGACMMRSHFLDVTTFCPVCQYALVDFIDPTKHGEIDAICSDTYIK